MQLLSRILVYIIAVVFVLLISTCDSTDPKPPDVKPPGYQEDINWPSLADSPWPMYRGDPQNTCRSKFSGPEAGIIEWSIDDSIYFNSPPALSNDNAFYIIGSTSNEKTYLFKFDLAGNIILQKDINVFEHLQCMMPLLDSKGNVFISSRYNSKLFAFSLDGNLKWELDNIKIQQSGISITRNGNLIFINSFNEQKLLSVDAYGKILWENSIVDLSSNEMNTIGIDINGENIFTRAFGRTYCVSYNLENQSENWRRGIDIYSNAAPIIDDKNNLIILDKDSTGQLGIYYINSKGENIWKHNIDVANIDFAFSKNGNIIYIGNEIGSLNLDGVLNWSIPLPENEQAVGPVTIDSEDNIYTQTATSNNTFLTKYDSDGIEKWRIEVGDGFYWGYPLIITSDGSLLYKPHRSRIIMKIK